VECHLGQTAVWSSVDDVNITIDAEMIKQAPAKSGN